MEFVILILGLLFVVGYGSWNDVSDGGTYVYGDDFDKLKEDK